MSCGCNKRTRAAARGQQITGYRVLAPKANPEDPDVFVPPLGTAPFLSQAEARAQIRKLGGGTARAEYKTTS